MFKVRDLYYQLKPVVPRALRLEFRRMRARSILRKYSQTWPICEAAGRVPEGWPGWPEDKQFGFVLSHDVEGSRGLARCRGLAELEMRHGFRSVFNFVPKGEYVVPRELLDWLVAKGFEVGVHDCHHDGSLFRSRREFERQATDVNQQLREWGAVGFRAGFMLHELDWLHALDIEHDSSTFDVDPFEPQADGVETIFPFWIPRPDPDSDRFPRDTLGAAEQRAGYVEMPYTLVQDYNLFIVLEARTTELWERKVRWICDHGGMAYLNTHPDYMAFDGEAPAIDEYPAEKYAAFLGWVREQYGNTSHHALPREIAAQIRMTRSRQARSPRRIVMLSYSHYKSDNRVRRYAEALAGRGDRVKVFCIGNADQLRRQKHETFNGVEIVRLVERPDRGAPGWQQAWRMGCFFVRAMAQLRRSALGGRCDLIHVHNIPDILVVCGLWLKLTGSRVILDIHDILPEFYQSKFGVGRGAFPVRLLLFLERLSCRLADHVIVANHLWKKVLGERALPVNRITALVNNVDLKLFHRRERTRDAQRIILIYPGTLNRHQGLDVAIQAVARLVIERRDIQLHIYGNGPEKTQLKNLTEGLGLAQHVRFFPGVYLDEVPSLMANADIGIVPKRAEGFGDQAYSTKIMEFMSQGLPVVVSRTRIDTLYFSEQDVAFFRSGDVEDLMRVIRRIIGERDYRLGLARAGLDYARNNSWEAVQEVYLDLVDRLTATAEPTPTSLAGTERNHGTESGNERSNGASGAVR